WIIQADPDAARDRAETAAKDRHLRLSGIADGHVAIWGLVDAADGIDFDQAINQIAASLPNDPTAVGGSDLDARRAAAVGILARSAFGQHTLPTHTLVVHIQHDDPAIHTSGQADSGMAYVDKWGPLLTEQLPKFLAGSKVIVRPIIDPATITAIDGHDPTGVMRFAVEQRNPVDVFPYGTRAATNCDLDHTVPYVPGVEGQTHLGNLGPLSRFTHRAKNFGGWRLQQPEPGGCSTGPPLPATNTSSPQPAPPASTYPTPKQRPRLDPRPTRPRPTPRQQKLGPKRKTIRQPRPSHQTNPNNWTRPAESAVSLPPR
ncbi:MAG: DUF222 domain-containing protein, partial [Brooklawnia sp.]|uniref:DUF222 domain-containing protein n=1 Tax=Brooklawnia sp. TaxID=2699740 RepID=UPI003C723CDD